MRSVVFTSVLLLCLNAFNAYADAQNKKISDLLPTEIVKEDVTVRTFIDEMFTCSANLAAYGRINEQAGKPKQGEFFLKTARNWASSVIAILGMIGEADSMEKVHDYQQQLLAIMEDKAEYWKNKWLLAVTNKKQKKVIDDLYSELKQCQDKYGLIESYLTKNLKRLYPDKYK